MRVSVLSLTLCLSAVAPVPGQDAALATPERAVARDAAAIVADYEAVSSPRYDGSRAEEEGYLDGYWAARRAADASRAALALELFSLDPEHERLVQLMPVRWSTLSDDEGRATARAEAASIIARAPQSDLAHVARDFEVKSALDTGDLELARVKIAALRAAHPDDERAASHMGTLARQLEDSDAALAIYREMLAAFPESRATRYTPGKIRQLTEVGQPLALGFDDAVSGRHVDMESLRGKVVVLDFWATWCGPCVAEMPHMKELYAEFAPQGVEFLGISLDNSEDKGGLEKLKAYVAEHEVPWPQYYQGAGWEGEFSTAWGINSIPSLFVVDATGKLASVNARGQLESLLPELLALRE